MTIRENNQIDWGNQRPQSAAWCKRALATSKSRLTNQSVHILPFSCILFHWRPFFCLVCYKPMKDGHQLVPSSVCHWRLSRFGLFDLQWKVALARPEQAQPRSALYFRGFINHQLCCAELALEADLARCRGPDKAKPQPGGHLERPKSSHRANIGRR